MNSQTQTPLTVLQHRDGKFLKQISKHHLWFWPCRSSPCTRLRWCCLATPPNCPGSWPGKWGCRFLHRCPGGSLFYCVRRWCSPAYSRWTCPTGLHRTETIKHEKKPKAKRHQSSFLCHRSNPGEAEPCLVCAGLLMELEWARDMKLHTATGNDLETNFSSYNVGLTDH